jgi:four helix bundle protein
MKSDLPERTMRFAVRIVKLCKTLDKQDPTSRTLARQLLRSGTSVGANVEEAVAGQSKPDFISKQNIALKEARETHYWLRLLVASELVPAVKLEDLLQEANELVAILTTIVRNAKS